MGLAARLYSPSPSPTDHDASEKQVLPSFLQPVPTPEAVPKDKAQCLISYAPLVNRDAYTAHMTWT